VALLCSPEKPRKLLALPQGFDFQLFAEKQVVMDNELFEARF
jgi:hypothetical protein